MFSSVLYVCLSRLVSVHLMNARACVPVCMCVHARACMRACVRICVCVLTFKRDTFKFGLNATFVRKN